MIVLECEQGTQEWLDARLGIPTASRFSDIITATTLQPSKSSFSYLCECAAEWMIGEPLDAGQSPYMDRGRKMENEAIKWYEFQHDVTVRRVGLVLRDDRAVGCSPDGLVGDDGGLEIKCPGAKAHVAYLLRPETLAKKYHCQVQGSLWLTGRRWWDIVSYNPGMERVCVRVEPDKAFFVAFDFAIALFVKELHEALVSLGYKEDAEAAA